MKAKAAQALIARELQDLDVPKGSQAYALVMEQALGAAEVLTRAELIKYVADYVESLPTHLFN